LDVIVIRSLRIERWSSGGEIGHDHIGDDGSRFGKVEADECRVHGDLFEILASSQEFGIMLIANFASIFAATNTL
jgi:hypothetical protein